MVEITFPRDFPLGFTGECPFELVPIQSSSLSGSASPSGVGIAPSFWRGEWSTEVLTREEYGIWTAWLASLRGKLRMFKGRPHRHRWPLRHPRGFAGMTFGGDPFSGLGSLAAIGASRDVVTIDDLPDGLTLSVGDYFSIPAGTRQRIHTITAGGVSSGNAAEVMCDPPIVPGVGTGVAVRLDAPYCEMTLMEKTERPARGGRGGTISFVGQQVLV